MDQSGTSIQMPPREANDGTSTPITYGDEGSPEDETLIPITIYGSPEGVELAKSRLEAIVTERAAKVVHTARLTPQDFEGIYWPFVKREFASKWAEDGVDVEKPSAGGVEIKGEKEKVAQWATDIKSLHDSLVGSGSLPRRRYLERVATEKDDPHHFARHS
jgi:hypothetical protein